MSVYTICALRGVHHRIEFLSERESALRGTTHITTHRRMCGEAFGNAEQSEWKVRAVVARQWPRQPVDLNIGRFAMGCQLAASAGKRSNRIIEQGRHLGLFEQRHKTLLAQTLNIRQCLASNISVDSLRGETYFYVRAAMLARCISE
jgi:hypothetical protein